jgi:hypothetical protein
MSRDSGQTWPAANQAVWNLQDIVTDPTDGYSDGDVVTLHYHVRAQKGDVVRFRLTVGDWTGPDFSSDGRVEWLGASMTYIKKPGTARVKAAVRR